ncbi:MAG: DegT/DnrJ/EryC1/StrS family aminotransferase [Planctomycetes bacterium]|nr:DegT/DnrJ/EryC1/StrS family aminotransferase [Planctomycetota bacterium]
MNATRVYLSPPHLGGDELSLVQEAFATNWVAPIGPHVDAFEREMAARLGVAGAVALSSGTAALHLALVINGVGPGDQVWCASLTFCGSANPIAYVGATPVFIDSERRSWNLDPALVAQGLDDAARAGRLPKAIISVDLYGQSADYEPLVAACERHGVALIEDAAEALGATYRGKPAGAFGRCAILSFNGNKIITTSGGGMLLSNDQRLCDEARFLATQARDPAPWYQHSRIGYNFRLSNVCAAIGRGQLRVLDERVNARRRLNARYRDLLSGLPGLTFAPDLDHLPGTRCTRWLTVIQLDPKNARATPEELRLALEAENIESRPVWKPMHLQPVFAGCAFIGGGVAEELFMRGLCLPSGSSLSESDQDRVVTILRHHLDGGA